MTPERAALLVGLLRELKGQYLGDFLQFQEGGWSRRNLSAMISDMEHESRPVECAETEHN